MQTWLDRVEVTRPFERAPSFVLGRSAIEDPEQLSGEPPQITGAAGGVDEQDVRLRTVGELIEHGAAILAGRLYRAEAVSYDELLTTRAVVVDPLTCIHRVVSPHEMDSIRGATPLTWCQGRDLVGGGAAFVPALLSFARWSPPDGEPIFIRTGGSGLAAHTNPASAAAHGLLEVLERDACMLSWRVPGWPVRKLAWERVSEQLQSVCRALQLHGHLYQVGDASLCPVVVVLLARPDGSELTVGSAAGTLWALPYDKAVCEALMLRWTAEGAAPWDGGKPGSSLGHVMRAFQMGPSIVDWYEHQAEECKTELRYETRTTFEIASTLGSPIVSVPLGEEMTSALGWHVVRVVVPGALPRESDHNMAHLSGIRLAQAMRAWSKGREVHRVPHPFG